MSAERIKAVTEFGFTERQARFLVTVMLHGGVCVPRQYVTFVGTAYGRLVNEFFDKLVSLRYVTRCRCRHNRAHVYHVRHEPLYRAIGEPHSRNRRPVPAARVAERLMLLDAVLSHRDLTWLATASEKVAFFTAAAPSIPTERLPHIKTLRGATRRGIRLFPDALPIAVDATGRLAFVYLVTTSIDDDLRGFVQRHGDLLRALPGWTIRLVFPSYAWPIRTSLETTIHNELATPLSPGAFSELLWYFEQCRLAETSRPRLPSDTRFRRAEQAFAGTRFRVLYRRWLSDGDAAFDVVTSTVIRDALSQATGRIECEMLPLSYRHLSPLVSLVHSKPQRVEEGEETPEETFGRSQPPRAEPHDDDPVGCARDWYRLVKAHHGQAQE